MKTLAFVLRFHALQFVLGLGLVAGAIGMHFSYVPTPAGAPYESIGDMVHPWFEVIVGVIGLGCVVSAWLKGRTLRAS
ncbi:hypothetical protein A8H39_01645 [Paraburkholderia fungorum]|uniref:hypothetical protein n=1 Tax=Paraburkholderia fungorum TaxID=134537 RepID=UPI000482782C|nr:hypothetical protein [Paraburkholderia fungorum]PNE59875.1 hypothetical protein A8H39_01645 [Paraburkholderia fungorum]